jgi:RHS repeat-associated protein
MVAESYGAGFDELYSYDGLYRLKLVNRGTLNSTQTAIVSGTGTFNQCWTLDSTGNWNGFREDDTGSGTWNTIQTRSANTVNEITGISNSTGSVWTQPAYDNAGNMTTVPQPANPGSAYTATYDAWNRQVKLVNPSTSQTVQTNAYDGRNYRIIRNSFTAGDQTETRDYFYTSSWQSIEERVGATTNPDCQLVWGLRFIDDLVLRDRNTTGGDTLNERLFGLQDPLGSVIAIVNSICLIEERYAYSPYGEAEFLSSLFTGQSGTLFDWDALFAGYHADLATRLYQVRERILNCATGAWVTRDPIRYSDGTFNLYLYVNARATIARDPTGMARSGPDALAECNAFLTALLADKSVASVPTIATALKCNVNLFCSNTCGPGGLHETFVSGGYVHICIDADEVYTEQQLLSVLLHETVHADQYISPKSGLCCKKPFGGPPPAVPPLARGKCSTCKARETPAYTANCKYEYSDSDQINKCVAAGLYISCSHVCRGLPNRRKPIIEYPVRPIGS